MCQFKSLLANGQKTPQILAICILRIPAKKIEHVLYSTPEFAAKQIQNNADNCTNYRTFSNIICFIHYQTFNK